MAIRWAELRLRARACARKVINRIHGNKSKQAYYKRSMALRLRTRALGSRRVFPSQLDRTVIGLQVIFKESRSHERNLEKSLFTFEQTFIVK